MNAIFGVVDTKQHSDLQERVFRIVFGQQSKSLLWGSRDSQDCVSSQLLTSSGMMGNRF